MRSLLAWKCWLVCVRPAREIDGGLGFEALFLCSAQGTLTSAREE